MTYCWALDMIVMHFAAMMSVALPTSTRHSCCLTSPVLGWRRLNVTLLLCAFYGVRGTANTAQFCVRFVSAAHTWLITHSIEHNQRVANEVVCVSGSQSIERNF
jgi:hypothetical protein